MKNSLEDPRTQDSPEGDALGEKEFLDSTAHVPETISSDNKKEFADVQPAQAAQPGTVEPGWTADDVAHIFAGFFMILSFPMTRPLTGFGGDHWDIPDAKCRQLGQAWLPIFRKHIPYDRKPGMVADLFMWLPAMGAIKSVCSEPIKTEIALRRAARAQALAAMQQKQNPQASLSLQPTTMAKSSTANTPMATPSA